MKSLDSFLKKYKPQKKRKSKLRPFKNEIFELFEQDYQIKFIQIFLRSKNVVVAESTIYHFLKTEKKDFKSSPPIKPKSKQQQEDKPDVEEEDAFALIKSKNEGKSLSQRVGDSGLLKNMGIEIK